MRVLIIVIAAILAIGTLSSCAPGPNDHVGTPDSKGAVAGFWRGLWNGMIVPITFFISLFNDKVEVYEVHNNGNWYDFGFFLGLSMAFGGGAGGAAARRRRG